MRDSIINLIIAFKKTDDSIMVLDADCSHSTRSILFKTQYADSFINLGIAEQNMIGIAVGLSLMGNRVIVNGFANILCLRSLDFIQQLIAKQKLPVIILGHYAGLSASQEGASHHSINSISIIKSIPNIHIYNPYGNINATKCFEAAYKNIHPTYINIAKANYNEPLLYTQNLNTYECGYDRHRLVICTGIILEQVIQARKLTETESISFDILALSDLNNFQILREANKYDIIWLVEDAYKYGGIYSDICMFFMENNINKKVHHICLDTFTRSGTLNDLYEFYNISAEKIANVIVN